MTKDSTMFTKAPRCVLQNKKDVKICTIYLLEKRKKRNNLCNKVERIKNLLLLVLDLMEFFLVTFKSELHWVQYQILNRIVPTSNDLFKI